MVLSLAAPARAASTDAKKPPNVSVILSDDVGWSDLGCYGATKIKTPNLDSLARDGLRFTDAHASASVCTPTRYSLLTGQYAFRVDAVGLNRGVANGDSPLLIPVSSITLPKIMKIAGYRTAAVGKWHLGFGNSRPDYNKELAPGPLEIGFDEFFGFPATNDRIPTVFVRDRRVVDLDPADPISYSCEQPADPNSPLKKFSSGKSRIGWISGGKAAQWKDEELTDNTLVIFSSDNGAYVVDEKGHQPNGPWRGKKSHLWEGGHRVPFIARWPGHIAPGVSDALVSLVDLPATAAALVGGELAAAVPDSFNLLPTLLGKPTPPPRDHLILMSGKGNLCIRQGKWKYIPDLETTNGWDSWKKKDKDGKVKAGLYDLETDHGETQNLAEQKPEILKCLHELLKSVQATPSTRPR